MKIKRVFPGMMLTGFFLLWPTAFGHAQGGLTHMGQSPDQHVALENVESSVSPCADSPGTAEDFVRVRADGVTEAGVFRIPQGESFVVTDFDWLYNHPEGTEAAGKRIVLRLWITNLFRLFNLTGNRPVAFSATVLNDEGKGGASEHLTGGIVVSSGAVICVDRVGAPAGSGGPVTVRGYLLED